MSLYVFCLTVWPSYAKISKMKNIYLVGFMATGKTAVGKELAKKLQREFFDLDDLIEQRQNMRIVDIFREKGEPYFRRAEKDLVKEVSSKTDLIVGCGGGAIVDEENLTNLKKSGTVICLSADIDTILKRTQDCEDRPLLNVDDRKSCINNLLKKREPFYNQANHTINTTNLNIQEVVNKIIAVTKD